MKFISTFLIVSTLLSFVSLPTLAKSAQTFNSDVVHVFILAGQSNMQGRTTIPAVQVVNENVLIWNGTRVLRLDVSGNPTRDGMGTVKIESMGWRIAQEPVNIYPNGRFSPSTSFANSIIKQTGLSNLRIGLINCAVGGTSIEQWSSDGEYYRTCLRLVKQLMSLEKVVIDGVIWSQGESNTISKQAADNWLSLTKQLYENFKRDLNNNSLPFVFAQLGYDIKSSKFPYWTYLQNIQPQLVGENIAMISTKDLSKNLDRIHFNTKSQIIIGERLATAFLTISTWPK